MKKQFSAETSIADNIKPARFDAWESTLQVLRGWLLNLGVEIPKPSPVVINSGNSLTAADEIERSVVGLPESEVRSAEIFALRYGVAG